MMLHTILNFPELNARILQIVNKLYLIINYVFAFHFSNI